MGSLCCRPSGVALPPVTPYIVRSISRSALLHPRCCHATSSALIPPVIPELDAAAVARIASVGVDLPSRRVTTSELVASCRHPLDADLERLTGIRERRVCAPGEDSYTLATAAALDCLQRSGTAPHGC